MNKRVRKSVTFDKNTAPENVTPVSPTSHFPRSFSRLSLVPFHLPTLLYVMFRLGLTSNVSSTLLTGLWILLPLQAVYNAHLCSVMSAGSALVMAPSSILISLVLSIPMLALIILAGAPAASHLTQTSLMAVHLAVSTMSPLFVYFAFDTTTACTLFAAPHSYRRIFSSTVLASSAGAVLGTWLGVLPIPLDWDRPWQQWPITLLSGGYIMAFFGGVFSLVVPPL